MAIRFRCTCGQKLEVADQAAGKRGRCPNCEHWLKIPHSFSVDTVDTKEETAELAPVQGSMAELPSPGRSAATAPNGRVAVADSHEGCRKSLAAMLREHDYIVQEAQDGPTAIIMIRIMQPDAAIIDTKLALETGFHVAETIRSPLRTTNKALWKMPILMTTAVLSGRDKQYAMHLGACGYFVKPVTAAELCPRLEKAIRTYRGIMNCMQVSSDSTGC